MALHSNAEELKDYIFHNPDQLKNPMFVLTHAPFCAMKLVQNSPDKEIYARFLKQMLEASPYAVPYWYIGCLRVKSKEASAKECKDFLRQTCEDLDTLVPWYQQETQNEYMDKLRPTMVELLKTFIASVRDKQKEIGANESVIADYSPIVPYSATLKRADEVAAADANIKENRYTYLQDMVDNYGEIYCYPEIREKDLGRIALSNANSIIDNVKIAFEHWHSIMDLFSTYQTFLGDMETSISCDAEADTLKYLAYIWLLNQNPVPTPEEVYNQYKDFKCFNEHKMNPLKPDEFKQVFESMCGYKTGDINDMLCTEAWTALTEDSQEFIDKLLEHTPKDRQTDIYDLDALLAELYTMRHIETNDYTNQFFLAEYPNITINNYTYINNNIMACEINDKYLAIPFVDIAADYNIKVLTIDKNHEIKVWDDPNDFDIILIP